MDNQQPNQHNQHNQQNSTNQNTQNNMEAQSVGSQHQHEHEHELGNVMMDVEDSGDESWQSDSDQDQDDEDDDISMDEDDQQQDQQQPPTKLPIKPLPATPPQPLQTLLQALPTLPPLKQLLKLPPSKKIPKQVCAKVIKRGDTVIQCYQCRMDETCIICLDCFKGGNHQGHRFVAKQGGGGCCDCGDGEAWSQAGFCKSHSGKFQDFQIQPAVMSQFQHTMHTLFYLHLHLTLTANPSHQLFTIRLLDYLKQLNQDNPYYNKLTSMCLTQKLPPQFSLNEEIDKKTILENLLTSRISGRYFGKWFQVFISMFSYYPFKMAILRHYLQNYGDVVDGQKYAINNALSISCQLITSYKLVEHYSLQNKIGLGQKSKKPTSLKPLLNYYQIFLHDISSLSKLSNKASYNYWKMHINSHQSLKNLFHYYKVIMKKVKKQESTKSEAELSAIYINFAEVELNLVEAVIGVVSVVGKERDWELLGKVVGLLWVECEKSWGDNPETLCMLRPYQRCLTIALFTYFKYSLENIKESKEKLVKNVLKISQESFQMGCKMILTRMWKTLFFYAKSQAQPGLGQTLYLYLYIYKIHSKILFMTDILSLKLFLLLLNKPHPLTFQSIIDLDEKKMAGNEPYIKQKINYFVSVVKSVKFVYTHLLPELHVAAAVDVGMGSGGLGGYGGYVEDVVMNYFRGFLREGGCSVAQTQLKNHLLTGILPNQCKIAQTYLKTTTTLSKQSKTYNLNPSISSTPKFLSLPGLNYDDFLLDTHSKDPYSDITKSAAAITGQGYSSGFGCNRAIFQIVWNQISLESLGKIFQVFGGIGEGKGEGLEAVLPVLGCVYLVGKGVGGKYRVLEEVLMRFSSKLPPGTITLLQLEQMKQQQPSQTQQQKKQKIQDLKSKKLQKLKQKQQAFLSTTITPQPSKQQPQPSPQPYPQVQPQYPQPPQQQCCCICRNDLNQNSVYIVNMNVRNHEKLLNLGEGVECLNFSSCRHVFDYKCVEKMYKKNSVLRSITCPLCKAVGNMVFPVLDGDGKLLEEVAERVFEILKQIKENGDFYQQIVKSFYHYFLLCSINLKRTLQQKQQLYHKIFTLLQKNLPESHLSTLSNSLTSNKFCTEFDKDLQQQKNQTQKSAMSLFFNFLANQNQVQVAEFQEAIIQNMGHKQVIQDPKGKEGKEGRVKKEKKVGMGMGMEGKGQFWLFREGIGMVLEWLRLSKNGYQLEDMMGEEGRTHTAFILSCIRTLAEPNPKFTSFQQQSPLNLESIHILRQLPQHYSQIGSHKKCSACNQISVDLIMCLLCDWCGCQNCQGGYAKTHTNQTHGQIGAVMLINKATAYYLINKETVAAGKLYEDEWQTNLNKSTNWDSFELNTRLYGEMERRLKEDDLPNRHARKIGG